MIKKIAITCILFLNSMLLWSQSEGVSIGKGRVAAHEKSILELVSDSKGLLIPRLTTSEREAMFVMEDISANGLMVYDNQESKFYFWDGSKWNNIGSGDQNLIYGTLVPDVVDYKKGDMFFDETTKSLYVHNLTEWVAVNNSGSGGDSAYQIWLTAGNTGTEADFLASLIGAQGIAGTDASVRITDNLISSSTIEVLSANQGKFLKGLVDVNTSKIGITSGQATAITSNASDIATNATAIALNTAKTGITTAQSNEITINMAKVGITSGQASNIGSNKTGVAANLLSLAGKVDKVSGKALSKNDFTDVLKTKLEGAEITSNKNVANGYVGLNGISKIDVSHLPSITINDVHTVVSLAAQNALTPNQGDVAIRTDESKNYIYDGTTWVLLASPTVQVSSVNGKTGVVNLELGDISTLQTSLNSKVDKLTGKELSANDFTDILKTKLDGLAGTTVTDNVSSNSSTDALSANQGLILKGLIDVNTAKTGVHATAITSNTSDIGTNVTAIALNTAKTGITTAQANEITTNTAKVGITTGQATDIETNKAGVAANLSSKVDKVSGKELSANDFTDVLKTKLEGAEITSNKNIANGYVGLNGISKIDVSHLPSITINEVYTVESLAAQNALTPNQGDVAIRTDESKNYIYDGTVWVLLASPSVDVSSVNGKTGVVNLELGDIATLQTSLNSKVDKVTGKALSTNDFTDVLKTKLDGLANTTVVDDLTTGGTAGALSAEQGKTLKGLVDVNTAKTGITSGQASEITANTAKIGITSGQATAINNNAVTITSEATTARAAENANATHIGVLETEQTTQNSAIALNTAKTGITAAQSTAITDNATAITDEATTARAAESANASDVGALETEQTTQNSAIALNTAKTGISSAQADAITDNATSITDEATTARAAESANASDIADLETEQTAQNSAIALNTSKTGITVAQTTAITDNATAITDEATTARVAESANTSDIADLETEQTTQNSAIALNTAKTGITTVQTDAIVSNTAKSGISPAQATTISNTSGINTGDQDISGIADNTTALGTKVDKVTGKELSANDFTDILKTKLDGAEITSNKNIANGYVGLNANTKIDVSHLPSITINDVYTVVSLAAQNALTPVQGDVAIRTDESKNYIYDGAVWVLLASPSVDVSSVNGKTGVVNLELGDIATLQTNLDSKVDKVTGKALSTNDFTDTQKNKLDGLSNTVITDLLTSISNTEALSANQGKILKDLIDAKVNITVVDDLTTGGTTDALSAEQGKVLEETKMDKSLTDTRVYIGDASNNAVAQTITGDVSMTSGGVVTIGQAAVDSDKIQDYTITTSDLASGIITAGKIASDAVGSSHIGSNVIQEDHINNDAIITRHIGQSQVTADKLSRMGANGGTSSHGWVLTFDASGGDKWKAKALPVSTVTDNLTSTSTTEALSANQGKVLKGLIDAKVNTTIVDDLTTGGTTDALSAEQGKTLKTLVDGNATNIGGKVDKVTGKDLSTNDYTDVEKIKLASLANTTVVDDLTTGGTTDALSAEQGKVLEDTKLTKTLADASVFVGDASNNAVATAISGDATLANDGALAIADNAVDGTDISLTDEAVGDMAYFDGTNWVRLPKGTANQSLIMNAGATAPEWSEASGGGTSTDLIYFSYVPKAINTAVPNTGGTNGIVKWLPTATNMNYFDPNGIVNADEITLDLPAGRYEAITTAKANSSKLVEMGVFLDGVRLNHINAPKNSGTWSISSTTGALIFDVPTGGGAVTLQKVAASAETLYDLAFTLKQLPDQSVTTNINSISADAIPVNGGIGAADNVLVSNGDGTASFAAGTGLGISTDLIYFSYVPNRINANLTDTGGYTGTVKWLSTNTTMNLFDPDGIVNADEITLDLPAGRYEAITAFRAGHSRLVEMGVFLDGVELNHIDAPINSSGTRTISSTTAPLIFDVPTGGGAVTVQKIAASDNVQNFSFTLKQLPGANIITTTISASDIPVNDQSTSGYMDIGNMRIQWGQETYGGAVDQVTLPAPFKDATYAVTTNSNYNPGGAVVWSSARLLTSTGFSFVCAYSSISNFGNPTGHPMSWMAIGLKP